MKKKEYIKVAAKKQKKRKPCSTTDTKML